MAVIDQDLWPSDFAVEQVEDDAPVLILKQQAKLLSDKTGGVVVGEVNTVVHVGEVRTKKSEPRYVETSDAVLGSIGSVLSSTKRYRDRNLPETVDKLNDKRHVIHYFYIKVPTLNYSYVLLAATHSIIASYPVSIDIDRDDEIVKCDNVDEFRVELKRVFGSEHTAQVIKTLLAQTLAGRPNGHSAERAE